MVFPTTIETERLILKKHILDKEYIQLWVDNINANLAWLSRFLSHFEEPMTFEKEESFLKQLVTEEKEINYGIWNKATGELMGSIGAFNFDNKQKPTCAELGILLFEKYAGQHYGPEGTNALANMLFNHGIQSVQLKIQKDNLRSRGAAQRAGYIWDGKETGFSPNHPNISMLVYRKFSTKQTKI